MRTMEYLLNIKNDLAKLLGTAPGAFNVWCGFYFGKSWRSTSGVQVCVCVLPHAIQPGNVVLVVTAYCCAFIVMAMFFFFCQAPCSFLFAVSFGGIVALSLCVCVGGRRGMYVSPFLSLVLSVLRLWSQLRRRQTQDPQTPHRHLGVAYKCLLEPQNAKLKWLLNCIPIMATHWGQIMHLRSVLDTQKSHSERTNEGKTQPKNGDKTKIRLLSPKCVTFWICSTFNICSNIYQDYVPGLGKECPGQG